VEIIAQPRTLVQCEALQKSAAARWLVDPSYYASSSSQLPEFRRGGQPEDPTPLDLGRWGAGKADGGGRL
jgi:hypothetical protein